MARLHFAKGTLYVHNKEVYLVRQVLLDHKFLVENQTRGGEERVSYEDLLGAWGRGELSFTVRGRNARRQRGTPPTEYSFADFNCLPESDRAEAKRRYKLIQPYLKLSRRDRSKKLAQEEAERRGQHPPRLSRHGNVLGAPRGKLGSAESPRSKQRWIKDFIKGGYDVRTLAPATQEQGGKGKSRLNPDVEEIVAAVLEEQKVLVTSNVKPAVSVDYLTAAVTVKIEVANRDRDTSEILCPPVKGTIYNRVIDAGLEHILNRPLSELEAHGNETAESGPRPERILERVEIDQTVIDLMIVDEVDRLPIGRPYFTGAIDCYSRYPWGLHVGWEPNNYQAVQYCLLNGILLKEDTCQIYGTEHRHQSYGLPENLVVDNGLCFVGDDLRTACGELGIHSLDILPVRSAWLKGRIERYIRTTNDGLLHYLPGTTFSNTVLRGDYDPAKHACISLSAFRQMLHIWLLDVYAERKHKGHRGIPARTWEAGVLDYPPALPHSRRDVETILMSTEYRTLQHYGIDFECLRYQSHSLKPLRDLLERNRHRPRTNSFGEETTREWNEVEIKYNQGDLYQISVFNPFAKEDESPWIEVSVGKEYAAYAKGLSVWKHHIIQAFARQTEDKPDIYALARAKSNLQTIVLREYFLTAGRRTRKGLQRFLADGAGVPLVGAAAQPGQLSAAPAVPLLAPPPTAPSQHKQTAGGASSGNVETRTKAAGNATVSAAQQSQDTSTAARPGATEHVIQTAQPQKSVPATPAASQPGTRTRSGWSSDYDLPISARDDEDDE